MSLSGYCRCEWSRTAILRACLSLAGLALNGGARATPQLVRIDGSIYDASGNPLTANNDIQIKTYDAAAGGTLLWTSQVYDTSVSNGRFTINLDASDTSVSSPSLMTQTSNSPSNGALWFEIHYDTGTAGNSAMDSDQVVRPRIRARGTAFALSAGTADAIRNIAVSTALPGSGQLLQYNGSQWAPAATSNIDSTKLAKAGDTMTGDLGLVGSQATPSRALILDASRRIASSSVTNTELGYLSGTSSSIVTLLGGVSANIQIQFSGKEPIQTKGSITTSTTGISISNGSNSTVGPAVTININTAATGVTGLLSGIDWTTFNGKQAALGFTPLNQAGDTMSGDLGLAGSQATPNRALILDSSRRVASSSITNTELGYLAGLTTALAPLQNGVTSNIQTQLNAKQATLVYTPVNRAGDTMSGTLNMGSSLISTSQIASGSATTSSVTCGTTALDFNNGNLQTVTGTIAAGSCTLTLNNMQTGGAYTIVFSGSATTNAFTPVFTGSSCSNWKFLPTSAATTSAKDSVYALLKAGTNCYVNWASGY